MSTGIIKFFNTSKKFGFITPDDGGKDVYLPATAVADTEAARLKAGQRVSFDREPDPQGEKATKLKLLKQEVVRAPDPAHNIKLYLDSADPQSEAVKEAICSTNHQVEVFDYMQVPLTIEQLKSLAAMLTASSRNIVRRYHPMFLELRLDDRFISEGDYWTAVAEHPVLIDGPIVVSGGRASICKSINDIDAFIGRSPRAETQQKPKKISDRLAAMINGEAVIPAAKAHLPSDTSALNAPDPALRKNATKARTSGNARITAPAETIKKKSAAKKASPARKPKKTPVKLSAKPKTKTAKKVKVPTKSKRSK